MGRGRKERDVSELALLEWNAAENRVPGEDFRRVQNRPKSFSAASGYAGMAQRACELISCASG